MPQPSPDASQDPGDVTLMSESVVATIAGLAASAVPGVLGVDGRAPTAVATVCPTHATVDLTLTAEAGADLVGLVERVRRSVAESVLRMTDLRVTEVSVTVVDVRGPDADPSRREH